MSNEIKPCPFCGGDKNTICTTDYNGRDAYAVSCRYPNCHGSIFTLGYGYFSTKDQAIAAWNTRALPAAPMGVKVKPLGWKECHEELRRKGQDFSARSPVRFYPISIHKKNDGWWLSTDQKTYPSLEAAQAAAFEIERDMVLAALAPSPAPALGDASPEVRALVDAGSALAEQAAHVRMGASIREMSIHDAAKHLGPLVEQWDAALAALKGGA
jgi:Lar family restriction alleviation protein